MVIVDTQFDVIVIGSGGAGLKAALSSVSKGAKTLVLTKGEPGRSGGTLSAHYSFCAVPPNSPVHDTPEQFAADIMKSSEQISDGALVNKLTSEAYAAIQYAEQLGIKFDRNKETNNYDLGWLAGHKFARAFHVGNVVGRDLVKVLLKKLKKTDVMIKGFTQAVQLHIENGQCCGVYAYDYEKDEIFYYCCKAVVIATGGGSQLYELNTNPLEATGDGYNLALDAGAHLIDMEFVQFYPTVLVSPKGTRGLMFNSGIMIPQGARLKNASDDDFWDEYSVGPLREATRDTMSRVIAAEIAKGNGTANGGIYIDASQVDADAIPQLQQKLLVDLGVDEKAKKYEVAPGAHYFMGGIKIDLQTATAVKGLYAAGECTGGLHGANRLAGNALSENQVFGQTAGEAAAEYALMQQRIPEYEQNKSLEEHKINVQTSQHLSQNEMLHERFVTRFGHLFDMEKVSSSCSENGSKTTIQLIKVLQHTMQTLVGVNRSKHQLEEAWHIVTDLTSQLHQLQFKSEKIPFNRLRIKAVDLYHMLGTAKSIIIAALIREESRGAHQRLDFPKKSEGFNVSIAICKTEETINSYKISRS